MLENYFFAIANSIKIMVMKELTASDFKDKVVESNLPCLVHFTSNNEFDSKISAILDEMKLLYADKMTFYKFEMTERNAISENYGGIPMTPTILIFVVGRVFAQILGFDPESKSTIESEIKTVLEKPIEGLKELNSAELAESYKPYFKNAGEWSDAITSGLVAGIIFAISRTYSDEAYSYIVPVIAIGFFITNSNFRFSVFQKSFAIMLMFIIGYYGENLVDWFRDGQ